MGKRTADDAQWQKVKAIVKTRDKGRDRFLSILTMKEVAYLKKYAPFFLLKTLDPAHYRSVGEAPELCYDANNIVLLNRWSHSNLDNMKNPISGHSINKEQHRLWWERILKGNPLQYKYLKDKGYLKEGD